MISVNWNATTFFKTKRHSKEKDTPDCKFSVIMYGFNDPGKRPNPNNTLPQLFVKKRPLMEEVLFSDITLYSIYLLGRTQWQSTEKVSEPKNWLFQNFCFWKFGKTAQKI